MWSTYWSGFNPLEPYGVATAGTRLGFSPQLNSRPIPALDIVLD